MGKMTITYSRKKCHLVPIPATASAAMDVEAQSKMSPATRGAMTKHVRSMVRKTEFIAASRSPPKFETQEFVVQIL